MLTWQVLIATIPHRHLKLCRLLAELDRQVQPGFGVLVYRDNLKQPVAVKRQVLLEAATAKYVSFVDDDDAVALGFVPRVMAEFSTDPDYVGFVTDYVVNGTWSGRAEHSIRYDGWHNWPERYVRDIVHLNPIRREIALLGRFYTGHGEDLSTSEDGRWADLVRASGRVRTEAWISETMYSYQFRNDDCHVTQRSAVPPGEILPLPSYPWLEALEVPCAC